jgi:integrating conjugative element protein (TIGR03765 family)
MVRPIATLAGVMLAASVYAQQPPVVIADRGGIPLADVINEGDAHKPQLGQSVERASANVLSRGLLSESLYPVISRNLSVGPVGADEARNISAHLLTQPMFIVGYDRVSANWLQSNVDVLEEKRAVGLVVNVDTPQQMERLLELTGRRLALTPMSGDQLAKAINLRHYPVFIDRSGVVR